MVLSATITPNEVPGHLRDKVGICREEPASIMARLKSRGWNDVYIDGGKVVQSCLRAGLIEDMTVTLIPVLLGNGIRLFGETESDIDLELTGSKTFSSGLVSNS